MTPLQLIALRQPCYSIDEQRDPTFVQEVRRGPMGLRLILTVDVDLDGFGFVPKRIGSMAWHASISLRDCHTLPEAAGVPQDAPAIPTVAYSTPEACEVLRALNAALKGVGGEGEMWFTSPCTIHTWRSLNGLEREIVAGRLD